MAQKGRRLMEAARFKLSLARWAGIARKAPTAALSKLRQDQQRAKQLRAHLDQLIHVSEERLAFPAIGSTNFSKPHNADWAWRPAFWRGPIKLPVNSGATSTKLGDEMTLFHDCFRPEVTVRQTRNFRAKDLAPYGITMDVFHFDGSFLSLAVDFPEPGIKGLSREHIIRVDMIAEIEQPLKFFARLNIKHGPNTEQIVSEVEVGLRRATAEFDLAQVALNEQRIEAAWLDLIFESPKMNQINLRDITICRSPRAQL